MEQDQTVVEESAAAKWARIIDQQRSSGLSVSVFCRERSVSVASYYAWRRRLATAEFVEARVVHDAGVIEPGEAGVRIELAGGRRVVVSRGFDRRLLLEVIQALEEIATGAKS